ncbi:MAG: DUF6249 domain-containing protein [Pseudomonadales bacterium]
MTLVDETWIPIVMFLTIGVVLALIAYFRFRTRGEIQSTVRAAIERGQELSPDLIESLMETLTTKHADLRRGIISLAIGAAFFLFAGFIGEEDAEGPLMGVAMFPALIGIGYLGLWFFIGRNK